MALTLPTGWAAAMTRAGASPIYYVFIQAGGGNNFSFTSGANDATDLQIYPSSIISVSAISQEIDPVTRKLSIGSVEIVMGLDGEVRRMVTGYVLRGKRVAISLGEKTLTAGTDYLPIFTGYIDDAIATSSTLSITVSSPAVRIRERKINDAPLNMHPLEAIKGYLLSAGVPSGDITAATFDPDTDTAISHFCVSRGKGYLSDQDNSIQGEMIGDVIDQLCELMVGGILAREDGKIEFKRFDASAAVVDIFTDDHILDIELQSVYENAITRVSVEIAPSGPVNWSHPFLGEGLGTSSPPAGGFFIQTDETAAGTLGDGTNDFYQEHQIKNPWISGITLATGSPSYPDHNPSTQQAYPKFTSAATALNFHNGHIHGVCGMRDSWPVASQPAAAKISAGRPIYLKLQTGEIVRSTNFAPSASASMLIEPAAFGGARSSAKATATVTRGQLGTSANTPNANDTISPSNATPDRWGFERWEVPAYDVTIAQYMADTILERFAYGAPVLKVRTDASRYAVQVADLIGIDSDELVGFSISLISGKWEVVKKEDDLLGDSPAIVWTLVKAERFGAAIDRGYIVNIPDYAAIASVRSNISQTISAKAAIQGFDPSSISGLNIKFDPGALVAQNAILPMPLTDMDLDASKFNYAGFDLMSGLPVLYTASAALPVHESATALILQSIETGAASITTRTDLRDPQTIIGNVIRDATLGPAHQNLLADTRSLVANADFGIWSGTRTVTTTPPDNWITVTDNGAAFVASSLWGGGISASTDSGSGSYSVEINTDAAQIGLALEQQVPVTPEQVYLVEARMKGTNAATEYELIAYYTDGDEVEGDLAGSLAGTFAAVDTWEVFRFAFRAEPAANKFLNALVTQKVTAGELLVDYFRITPSGPSANLRLAASTPQTITVSTDTVVALATAVHDDGDNFDAGTNAFIATEPGDYDVSGCVTIGPLATSSDFAQVWLAVNGTRVRRGAYVVSGKTSRTVQCVVSASALRLEVDDSLQLYVVHNSAGTVQVIATAADTFLNVRKVG